MGKVAWDSLHVKEEWTTIDPGDSNAVFTEHERIKELSTLILKAFKRYQLSKARHLKQRANDSEQRMGE